MSKSYITQRGHTTRFRRIIPLDLQERFGKRELTRSLGSVTAKAANQKARALLNATEELFMLVRSDRSIIKAEIDLLATHFLDEQAIKSEATLVDQLRPLSPGFYNASGYAFYLLKRKKLAFERQRLAEGGSSSDDTFAIEWAAANGFEIARCSKEATALSRELQRARIRGLKDEIGRYEQDVLSVAAPDTILPAIAERCAKRSALDEYVRAEGATVGPIRADSIGPVQYLDADQLTTEELTGLEMESIFLDADPETEPSSSFQQASSSDKAPPLVGALEPCSTATAMGRGASIPNALEPSGARKLQQPGEAIVAVNGLDGNPDDAEHPIVTCGLELCRQMDRGERWNKKTQTQAMQTYKFFVKTLIGRQTWAINELKHVDFY